MSRQATLYETLEVSPTASAPVIKAAYRCLAQYNHPDKNPHATSGERLAQINRAYSVLSDPQQRGHYDLELVRNARETGPPIERRGCGAAQRSHPPPSGDGHMVMRAFVFRPLA